MVTAQSGRGRSCASRANCSQPQHTKIPRSAPAQTKEYINQHICPAVARILDQFGTPARFTTTMSVFMYFFLQVRSHNSTIAIIHHFLSFQALRDCESYHQASLSLCSLKRTAGPFLPTTWLHLHRLELLLLQTSQLTTPAQVPQAMYSPLWRWWLEPCKPGTHTRYFILAILCAHV